MTVSPSAVSATRPPWSDRFLFLVLFALGAVVTVALKAVGAPQMVVTAVPVTVMIGYAVYVGRSPRYRLRADRAGDSLYYLGFLYTMVSIAHSLYEFSGDRGTEAVVTNFGIALVTTILGLTLRVVFQQMRDEPFDVEREVQADLNETAARLRGQLLNLEMDFQRLRTTLVQVTEETLASAAAAISKALADSTARLAQAGSALAETVKTTGVALGEERAALLTSSKRVQSAIERLAERLDTLNVPADLLKSRIDTLAGRFDALVTALEHRTTREKADGEALEEVRKETREIVESLKLELAALSAATANHRAGVHSALLAVDEGMRALRTSAQMSIDQATSAAEAQRRLHEGLLSSTRDSLQAAKTLEVELEGHVIASTKKLEEVHSSLVSLAALVVKKLDG